MLAQKYSHAPKVEEVDDELGNVAMKWALQFSAAALSLALCLAGQAMAEAPLKLSISMEKTRFHSNEPIIVKVELVNSSGKPIKTYTPFILEDRFLRFRIFDSNGNRMKYLGLEHEPKPEHLSVMELNPMAFFGQYINLREAGNINSFNKGEKFYQLEQVGTYKLQAVYEVLKRKGPWRGTLISNELTFTIE